jgi:ketosteroid isomerase-like protein
VAVVTNEEVSELWVKGLAGDWASLEGLASPSMRVWHSHDGEWLTREQSAARMETSGAMRTPPSMKDLRCTVTATGFVVQGWIEGVGDSGKTHIAQLCTVEDGRVASCEEYIAPEMNLV